MSFISIAHTDIGIKKKTNQDSVLIKEAKTDLGDVCFNVICDGMGGLAKGEVASATLIRDFSAWFEEAFPYLFYEERSEGTLDFDALQRSLNRVTEEANQKIAAYGESLHAPCGTTLAAMLLAEGRYFIMNIGDSRVYRVGSKVNSLTKDQTFVQMEADAGRMTKEEAENHPQRNVLLQCVGASPVIMPDFYTGEYNTGDIFLLCSDGFRHVISEEEFAKILNPKTLTDEKALKDAAVYCTELNKQRQETDNISVIITKVV